MKKVLLSALTLLFILTNTTVFSQVTLLSNNTNLNTGIVLNGKALFLSENADNDTIWVSNGTAAGTVKLTSAVSYVDTGGIAFYNSKLFFTGATAANGAELWATDGTAAGTVLIKDINAGAGNAVPTDFFVFNNTLFFTANDGSHGTELWSSNGTAAGTVLVKDINAGAGNAFTNNDVHFYANNGILYFVADNGTSGTELWKTDGTAGGTVMVKDITAGATGTDFTQFIRLGTDVIFSISVVNVTGAELEIWKTNGTTAGTTLIKNFGLLSGLFPSFFFPFNDKIYFAGTDFANTGSELWVTNGTTAGTTMVKDINPGTDNSFPFLFNAVVINNKFYFQATAGNSGSELWMSDGTTAGTQLLKDINPGVDDATPILFKDYDFTSVDFYNNNLYNGKVFFSADDGSHGQELWVTDGTAAGTVLVKDILPGANGALENSFSYFYTNLGLYFSADNGTSGVEPWLSNATSAGTAIVADVNPGTGDSDPFYLLIYNSQLYFNANNGDNAVNTDLFKINATVTTLPVTLFNFSATVQQSKAVQLNWATTNEINSSHFDVERSLDAVHFTYLNKVDASGNSSNQQQYQFIDNEPAHLHAAIIFYRLKMVDKDGAYKYSKVLNVRMGQTAFEFSMSPNPVQQQLNVIVATEGAAKAALRITDANGRQVYQQNLATNQTITQLYINAAAWQKGVYYIQLITDKTIKTSKFVKQ